MRAVGGKNTAPELAVRRAAHRLGFRFRLHRKDLPGCPDIVFPKWKTAIFVVGISIFMLKRRYDHSDERVVQVIGHGVMDQMLH